jgi:hypothetical protein
MARGLSRFIVVGHHDSRGVTKTSIEKERHFRHSTKPNRHQTVT